jgi:hypothetical protein
MNEITVFKTDQESLRPHIQQLEESLRSNGTKDCWGATALIVAAVAVIALTVVASIAIAPYMCLPVFFIGTTVVLMASMPCAISLENESLQIRAQIDTLRKCQRTMLIPEFQQTITNLPEQLPLGDLVQAHLLFEKQRNLDEADARQSAQRELLREENRLNWSRLGVQR